jgi:hypothetical protein
MYTRVGIRIGSKTSESLKGYIRIGLQNISNNRLHNVIVMYNLSCGYYCVFKISHNVNLYFISLSNIVIGILFCQN